MQNLNQSGILRNIGGKQVYMSLISIDPFDVILDIKNPRISYPLEQLPSDERTDEACELLLSTQQDIETLKRSIHQTHGVQEPIYLTSNRVVVEGNRRTVALRELKRQFPENPAFAQLPAWVIPPETEVSVINDLINSAHLDPKRPWAPFERAIVLMRLSEDGLDSTTLAERYEMKKNEVVQFIEAAELMINKYIPAMQDPHDPHIITRFSYFLEYVKGRMSRHRKEVHHLDDKFCNWVREGNIPKAELVRKLPALLEKEGAIELLDSIGFQGAWASLQSQNNGQDRFISNIIDVVEQIERLGTSEITDIIKDPEKIKILKRLHEGTTILMRLINV